MFQFTEPSSGQIQNTVLVRSVNAHIWFSEPKHVAVIFNFNIDYQYM